MSVPTLLTPGLACGQWKGQLDPAWPFLLLWLSLREQQAPGSPAHGTRRGGSSRPPLPPTSTNTDTTCTKWFCPARGLHGPKLAPSTSPLLLCHLRRVALLCVLGARELTMPLAQPALTQPSCPGSFSPQHCLPGWHQVAMQTPLLGAKGPQLAWSVQFSAQTGSRGLICRGRQYSGGNDGRFKHFLTLPEFQHNDVRIIRLFKSQRLGCFL